jgi:hypothetical protein
MLGASDTRPAAYYRLAAESGITEANEALLRLDGIS